MSHSDKTYLVTGASSGVGAEVIKLLLECGANIIGISRRQLSIETYPDQKNYQNLQWICCDLSDLNELEKILAASLKNINNLDGVVLCHGYGDLGALEQLSSKRIRRQIDTNLTSSILICRLTLPSMKIHKQGDVIIIGSESALKGGKNGAVYCATKFGLRGFVQALRQECASSGIRVGIVNPGMIHTGFFDNLDFTPGEAAENALQAIDVANAVKSMIDMPKGGVIDEINLSPLKTVIRNKKDIK